MARKGPYTVAGKAIAKEQAMLAALPHVEHVDREDTDYWSDPPVFTLCHYAGKDPKREERGFAPRLRVTFSCEYCGLPSDDDSPLPKHSRILTKRDQLGAIVETLAEVLGIDRWSDAALRASYAPQHENRGVGLDGQVAESLQILAGVLYRRDALAGMATAITDLNTVVLDGNDAPFMTEGGTYELLGKDNARTVLSLWNRVRVAAGR